MHEHATNQTRYVAQYFNKNGCKFVMQIDGDAFFEKKREEVI